MRESDDIGVREMLDVGGVYVDSRKPKLRMPQATRDSTWTLPRCRTRRDRKHSKELKHEIHPRS
jgi:hypothetical protein